MQKAYVGALDVRDVGGLGAFIGTDDEVEDGRGGEIGLKSLR